MGIVPKLIELEGPARARGQSYGRQADTQLRHGLGVYRALFQDQGMSWDSVLAYAAELRDSLVRLVPEAVEELAGIAEGANVLLEEVLVVNGRSEIINLHAQRPRDLSTADDGCTAAVVLPEWTEAGQLLHAQNWDWLPDCAESTVVLQIRSEQGPDILTYVEAGGLARAGFNSEGVAITGNNLVCGQDGKAPFGVPLSVIRRRVLEAGGYSQALTELYRLPRTVSNNMTISCATSGDCLNFETTPAQIYWQAPEGGCLTHANHFTSPAARTREMDAGIARGADTLFRDRRLRRLIETGGQAHTLDSLALALDDRFGSPRGIIRTPRGNEGETNAYLSATVAMVLMDAGAGEMRIRQLPYASDTTTRFSLS
ncbi:C45 family autoproteolytic acyltransferase/hydolase [Pseudodonghicola flavimaris]|uniref:C45 family autoproteolytic acyltransferase/hydrolase n=1 Tax=Pseudodonghicola flavimaris TaxID=3050036 RepID=A0ABT7F875_9RHOB|nr:C45 family peptidase [Pseudodonghicola flavimaris]MDK3020778.1 C45 family autoproteolytic acyltransferase/hydrolase [Pseudodonghicola flavimaris]